jgi:hypothetical protein
VTDEYRGRAGLSGNDLARLLGSGRLPRDISANHTVELKDLLYILRITGGSAIDITIPAVDDGYDFEPGSCLIVNNTGAGIATLVAASGVTLNNKDGLVSAGQHGWFGAYYWGDDEWTAWGALTT